MNFPFDRAITRAAGRALAGLLVLALAGCGYFYNRVSSPVAAGPAGAAPVTELITPQLIAAEQLKRESAVRQDLSQLVDPNPASYTIGRGDILSIVVWDHPELGGTVVTPASGAAELSNNGVPPSGFVVDSEGRIQFPFAGVLKLEGLTEDKARDLLASKLARYIAHPNVTLRVQA
jgi:polysaccharide export outer membrane protein